MRELKHNQVFESKTGGHHIKCLYRCKISKFKQTKKGEQKSTAILWNQCRLMHNQNKNCSHPNDSERTCNVPKHIQKEPKRRDKDGRKETK